MNILIRSLVSEFAFEFFRNVYLFMIVFRVHFKERCKSGDHLLDVVKNGLPVKFLYFTELEQNLKHG